MIIAIEGLDGVGKTTIAGLLRSVISDCELLHTPPRRYYEGNLEILRDLESTARGVLFIAGAMAVSERLSREGTPRYKILDRYLGSVAGMNRFLVPGIADLCAGIHLVKADLTIQLACDEDERRRRLLKRGKPLDPFERRLESEPLLRRAMVRSIEESSQRLLCVDTTNLPPGVAAKVCLYLIQRELPWPTDFPCMAAEDVALLRASLIKHGVEPGTIAEMLGDLPPESATQSTQLNSPQVQIRDSDFSGSTFVVGGERATGWVKNEQGASIQSQLEQLIADARSSLTPYHSGEVALPTDRTSADEPITLDDADEAFSYLEQVARGSLLDPGRANWALRVLEPLLVGVAASGVYQAISMLVSQVV